MPAFKEQILEALMEVQSECNVSTKCLNLILKKLHPFLKGCEHIEPFKMPRVRARARSPIKQQMHGCVGCNKHVFGPQDHDLVCPTCGTARYARDGKPKEVPVCVCACVLCLISVHVCCVQVCWFFPLGEQIKRLLCIPQYKNLLNYERQHRAIRRHDNFICDVYDTPRWARVVGPPRTRLTRIVLLMCVDGVPAYGRKEVETVKPIQYLILNLPPWLRYKLPYMLVHALIPAELKSEAARKYYDWLGINEITPLRRVGVDGVRVQVYGNTLDTPGRRELLNMQAVSAFYPCPHCLHTWQPGMRKQVYGGYRRFMEMHSPWRNKSFEFMGLTYEFRDVETRDPPILRTDRFSLTNFHY